MHVDAFIQTFAGEDTLSLLRCMAVANGNSSLDDTVILQQDALRYIIDYHPAQPCERTDWKTLAEEIYESISRCGPDPFKIGRYIYRILLLFRDIAPYFHSPKNADTNQKAINAFFQCITSSMRRAARMLEAVGYGAKGNLYSYNHKWDKPSFHAVAHTGITLETLGYVVQGCLLENGITTPILQYQDDCGVVLLDEVVPEQLATSMNWTINLARHYCTLMDGYRNATITTIAGNQNHPTIGEFPALLHTIEARLFDSTGRLLKPRSQFVRFCAENHNFGGLLLNDRRPIDGLLTDSKGRPVTAGKLAQSYPDIMTKSVQ